MYQRAIGEGGIRRRDFVGGSDDGTFRFSAEIAHYSYRLAATVAERRRRDGAAKRIENHQLDIGNDGGRKIAELQRSGKFGECMSRRGSHGSFLWP